MKVEVATTFSEIDKTAEALRAIGIFDWIEFQGVAGADTVCITGYCEDFKAAAVFHRLLQQDLPQLKRNQVMVS